MKCTWQVGSDRAISQPELRLHLLCIIFLVPGAPLTSRVYSQPRLRAVVRAKQGQAHRALTRGQAGIYHPSCASVPGPRGERSLPGKPESQREGGDAHHLQQGSRLGLSEASQHRHERETNELQACKCPACCTHLPWGRPQT